MQSIRLGQRNAAAGALPALEGLSLRFAAALTRRLQRPLPALTLGPHTVEQRSCADWPGTQSDALFARFAHGEFDSVLAVPVALVAVLTDRRFGGSGTAPAARRGLSVGERAMLHELATEIAGAFASAWPGECGARAVPGDETTIPVLADAAVPVVVHRAAVAHGEVGFGDLELVHRADALAPLATTPALPVARPSDPAWQAALAAAVAQTHLPVRTVLARPELPLSRLLALKAGDVLPVCLPPLVPVTVGGRLIGRGSVGEANGRAAVKLEQLESLPS